MLLSTSEVDPASEVVTAGHGPIEWREVDRRLREYARHRSALDAAEAFDLMRAEQLKIHVLFGYVTIYEYMERVLGYGPHAARERMRVARSLATLPETTAALARGATGSEQAVQVPLVGCRGLVTGHRAFSRGCSVPSPPETCPKLVDAGTCRAVHRWIASAPSPDSQEPALLVAGEAVTARGEPDGAEATDHERDRCVPRARASR
jgi:hypothetical protein